MIRWGKQRYEKVKVGVIKLYFFGKGEKISDFQDLVGQWQLGKKT